MKNPFLHRLEDNQRSDYVSSDCSINRLMIKKLPIYGVDDSIEGLTVKEFFNTQLFIDEIKKNADTLKIELDKETEKRLPIKLAEKLSSDDSEASECAIQIARKFGKRLGLLFLALRLGEKQNRDARKDWTDEHWDYWAQIEDIALVGGLASGNIGKIFKQEIENVFELAHKEPYNILLYENSAVAGVYGCATQISEKNGVNIVMDFGQTNIKRSYVTKCAGEITDVKTLDPYLSQYMDWEMLSEEETLKQAKLLHKLLLKAIKDTYKTAKEQTGIEPNREIVISIASYTVDGVINDQRSGYAKLSALGSNYAECLYWDLSGELRKDVVIKLIHDGTAFALNFSDRKSTICLSLGSFFGVGFPDTKLIWPEY